MGEKIMFNVISRSGQMLIKVNRPFDPTITTENDIFHLGFAPNDIEKIIGKPIVLIIDDGGTIENYPVKCVYSNGVVSAFEFEYSGNTYVIEPATSDYSKDEWTILED